MNLFKTRLLKSLMDKKWTQADLVRATGISKSMISDYVNGKFEPKADKLKILSDALDVSEAWLSGANEKYILENGSTKALVTLLSEILRSEAQEQKLSLNVLAGMAHLDLDMVMSILQNKKQYLDYTYVRLILALNLQEHEAILSAYYDYLPTEAEYVHAVGLAYTFMREQSDPDNNKINNAGYQNYYKSIEENPIVIDEARVNEYAALLGFNIKRSSIENLVTYYYYIPDYYTMGFSTIPLDELHLDLIDRDFYELEEYILISIKRLYDINVTNDMFESFTESLYFMIEGFDRDEREKFFSDMLKYGEFLVGNSD